MKKIFFAFIVLLFSKHSFAQKEFIYFQKNFHSGARDTLYYFNIDLIINDKRDSVYFYPKYQDSLVYGGSGLFFQGYTIEAIDMGFDQKYHVGYKCYKSLDSMLFLLSKKINKHNKGAVLIKSLDENNIEKYSFYINELQDLNQWIETLKVFSKMYNIDWYEHLHHIYIEIETQYFYKD